MFNKWWCAHFIYFFTPFFAPPSYAPTWRRFFAVTEIDPINALQAAMEGCERVPRFIGTLQKRDFRGTWVPPFIVLFHPFFGGGLAQTMDFFSKYGVLLPKHY